MAYSRTKPGGPKGGAAYKVQGASLLGCFRCVSLKMALVAMTAAGECEEAAEKAGG